ncbi:MAG TPA: methyltransferase domain-containing protein [Candidatus Binatia bacterium]|nr:methyltransferase domain-containing protein [Candidatus Binatia bacterium]
MLMSADTQIDQLQQPSVQAAMCDHPASRTVVDIGCGQKKVRGAIGMDCVALPGVDVVHDLNTFPYPFAADSIDEIHAYHVLEHVPDVMATMEELWRITKPGATVHIRVPHFSGILAWKDPTHKRSFTSESFGYFGENGYSYYTGARFQVMSVRLRYSIQPMNRWIARVFAKVIQWLVDRHPTFGERHLAYLVGGIDEIQATLRTVKP